MNTKQQRLKSIKIKGKGTLNQKGGAMLDKRTKRLRTRKAKEDKAIEDFQD